ncbi:Non-specific serine/threonine protein kinase [Bertholletia excelsa]
MGFSQIKMGRRVGSIVLLALLMVSSISGQSPATCNRSCGSGRPKRHPFPFPFGFSSGCPIRLNCTAAGTAVIDEFPVENVTADSILIHFPAKCDRPIGTLNRLFGQNYAPTSRNGILLHNCSTPVTACLIPTTMVQTNFESLNCGSKSKNNSISCYSEENRASEFIDLANLTSSKCKSALSAISVEAFGSSSAVALEVELVQLGWWLEGHCQCSKNANCTRLLTPGNGPPAYRCRCLEGFLGDGFRAGSGCRRASSSCNAAKYMSGQCGGATRVGVLVGGVAAGACLMISGGVVCCIIRRRSESRTRKRTTRHLSETTGITIPIYPYKEIERATNFFSDNQRLGTGAYGTVYAGKLNADDQWVAIKRIRNRDTDHGLKQVVNEIKLLSSVSHPNLVRLLGCCIDNEEQILVYEFMPNGTLSQHLHGGNRGGLAWPVRLAVAAETAQAIAYLHSAMNPPIYHRDIKSSNILLDCNFQSKVADFGLSRLGMTEWSHVSTAPQGTPGYLDPQYHLNFHLSDKSDVYSFGVVLVEIITGLKAVDFSRPPNEVNLASLATDRIGKGKIEEIIDPFINPHSDEWTISSVNKVAELAFRCLAFDREARPSMLEVAVELEKIRLSRWGPLAVRPPEEIVTASSDVSSCSSSSSASERPLSLAIEKQEFQSGGFFGLQLRANSLNSGDGVKDFSPVSVQDGWLISDQSSPSSNSLLGNVVK